MTGSQYLIESQRHKIVIDLGLFQGSRELRERNWAAPLYRPSEIDAVLLTHAHIDHIGLLPRIVELGLNCPIYCTPSTVELTKLLLLDSAHLQEQEADYRQTRGRSRHNPALPLYTVRSAEQGLSLLKAVRFHKRFELLPGVFATWSRMGHILGAAAISLEIEGKRITFSGDIGRYEEAILVNPEPLDLGELLLVESTYGDRQHGQSNCQAELARVVNDTYQRKGVVVVPCFAVGRAQTLLYYLRELKAKKLIPDIPVIIDSPMARDATEIYRNFPEDYDEAATALLEGGKQPFALPKLGFVQSTQESIRLNSIMEPMIILSASGMLSGGRILHHLKHRLGSPRNTVLFVGFQPPQSRGAWIKSGADSLRLFGQEVPIRAAVEEISGLSAHADQQELLRWCNSCTGRPDKVAVVHGEPEAAQVFSGLLSKQLQWNSFVAEQHQVIEL